MKKKRLISLLLCLGMLFALTIPVLAFPDVPAEEWYAPYVETCVEKGIFEGFEDGTFRPTAYLRRGEFIKMLAVSAGLTNNKAPTGTHWAEKYWIAFTENDLLEGVKIYRSYDSLQAIITRAEMAQLIYNYLTKVKREPEDDAGGARRVIPDFADVPDLNKRAVAQVYSKGIINGMINTDGVKDGSFCPGRNLTRAQAAAVMVRLLDVNERTPIKMQNPYVLSDAPNGSKPFAIWANEMGMFSGTGAKARLNRVLFGREDKDYFTSEEDAAAWMKTIYVNVWNVDQAGEKVASTLGITVHKYLAADVYDIFQTIFEDEEKFPIYSAGGARFSDTMRHAWGAAIDVNSNENCEASKENGRIVVSAGKGWWPIGLEKSEWAGSLQEPSIYSISSAGSVVRAFKAYGWGWGGAWSNSRDFMHFSIRPDGG